MNQGPDVQISNLSTYDRDTPCRGSGGDKFRLGLFVLWGV